MSCCCWSIGSRGVVLGGNCACFPDNVSPERLQVTIPKLTVSADNPCPLCHPDGAQAFCDVFAGTWTLERYTSSVFTGACGTWRGYGPYAADDAVYNPTAFPDGVLNLLVQVDGNDPDVCDMAFVMHLGAATATNLLWAETVDKPVNLWLPKTLPYQTGVGSFCDGPPEPSPVTVLVAP